MFYKAVTICGSPAPWPAGGGGSSGNRGGGPGGGGDKALAPWSACDCGCCGREASCY